MATKFTGTKGKVSFLRVNDGAVHSWGNPPDYLENDVIVKISSAPDMAFGFDVKAGDPHLAARLSMLASLRNAYLHDKEVYLSYWIEEGHKNGRVARVEYGSQ